MSPLKFIKFLKFLQVVSNLRSMISGVHAAEVSSIRSALNPKGENQAACKIYKSNRTVFCCYKTVAVKLEKCNHILIVVHFILNEMLFIVDDALLSGLHVCIVTITSSTSLNKRLEAFYLLFNQGQVL